MVSSLLLLLGLVSAPAPSPLAAIAAQGEADAVEAARRHCQDLVTAVRDGEFPMRHRDEDCGKSRDFRTVCRVAQARSVGKTPTTSRGAECRLSRTPPSRGRRGQRRGRRRHAGLPRVRDR